MPISSSFCAFMLENRKYSYVVSNTTEHLAFLEPEHRWIIVSEEKNNRQLTDIAVLQVPDRSFHKFLSLKIRGSMLSNHKTFDDWRILRLAVCERVGRVERMNRVNPTDPFTVLGLQASVLNYVKLDDRGILYVAVHLWKSQSGKAWNITYVAARLGF